MRDTFEKIDSREMRKHFGTLEEQLEHVFGHKVKLTTYYNACTQWKAASEDHREEAVAGGHTPAGRWSVLHVNILSNSSCLLDYIAIHIVTSFHIPPAFSDTLLPVSLDSVML